MPADILSQPQDTNGFPPIQRGWMPYAQMAKFYLGISPTILLGAIKAHELKAYTKPLTKGRKVGAKTERNSYFVCKEDVDTYIRTYWVEPFPE